MSQLISSAAGSSSAILTYDTKIPELGQAADIVEAFKLYHYGSDNFSGSSPDSKSIYNHLKTLQNNINAVLAKVSYTSGAPSAPEVGRLWVDSDTGEMYVYTGSSWQLVSASGSGGGSTSSDIFFLMGA